jgi:exopolysaccharide biosynthesis polyprenyl glycosylphosphotransferase
MPFLSRSVLLPAISKLGQGADRSVESINRIIPACSRWTASDLIFIVSGMLFIPLCSQQHDDPFSIKQVLQLHPAVSDFIIAFACLVICRFILKVLSWGPNKYPRIALLLSHLALRSSLCVIVITVLFSIRYPDIRTIKTVISSTVMSFFMLILSRAAVAAYVLLIRPHFRRCRNVIIVGSGKQAAKAAVDLNLHPRWRYNILGFVDSEPQGMVDPLLGGIHDLDEILMRHDVDQIVIALPIKSKYDEIQRAIISCERLGVQSGYSTALFATKITKRHSVERHDPSSVLLHMVHDDAARRVIKRTIDIFLSGASLIILSPLLALIALSIKITSRGPALFKQQRYGLNKRVFWIYKFRSMVADAEQLQQSLEHLNEKTGAVFKIQLDPRITPLGRYIRSTSLDELPQLWNVFKGDMSLVGPRPLAVRDAQLIAEPTQMRRFSVKPGLTGLWQVSGRSNTSFSTWMHLDLEYIDRWTFFLDLQIIAKTFPTVLKREGAI